jgi:hypothetical protein
MQGSVWVRIPGCPNYAISGDGQVMRITATKKFAAGLIMKPTLMKIGYFMASLFEDGKYRKRYVHRLVAHAFIPNPENKPEVNHKNGIKADSRIENLEWATHAENMKHSGENELSPNGERCPWAKLTVEKVQKIKQLNKGGRSCRSIAREFKVSDRLIAMICKGQRWSRVK